MLKSILRLIEDFVIQPASITTGVLFISGLVILFVINRNIKKSIFSAIKGSILSFMVIVVFTTVSIKLNNPKHMYLILPFLLNIWFFVFKENKHKLILSNLLVLLAFLSEYYLVEKLLFE